MKKHLPLFLLFFISLPYFTKAQFNRTTDSLILVELYNATNEMTWTTDWDLNTTINTWHGVTLDQDGCVIQLALQDNNLSGSLPASIGQLQALQELYLFDNNLTGSIPSEIGQLLNLTELQLDGNLQLSGTLPNELGLLSNLDLLSIANTQIAGSIPEELAAISGLRFLYLNNNALTGEIPTALGDLTDLLKLRLQNNGLSGPIPASFGTLSNLLELSLQNNNLEGCYPDALLNLCGIEYDFSNNPLLPWQGDFINFCEGSPQIGASCEDGSTMGIIQMDCSCINAANCRFQDSLVLDLFYQQTNGATTWENKWDLSTPMDNWYGVILNAEGCVVEINLDNNNLTGSLPNELSQLEELERLSVANNSLGGELHNEYSAWTNLHYFNCANNQITDEIPTGFGTIQSLDTLILAQNNFFNGVPAELGNGSLINLRTLDLSNNPLGGTIPAELGDLPGLYELNLNNCGLTGTIPSNFDFLGQLVRFSLANNQLEGSLPEFIAQFYFPQLIELNDNNFEGCFPEDWQIFCSDNVTVNTFNNPLLSWEGNFDNFCAGMDQIGAVCDDGNPETVSETIQTNCLCSENSCFNDAGTIQSMTVIGQSNDVAYLCLGDSMWVQHNGDYSLESDANPATLGGIVYPFYNCPPTIEVGYDLILDDPCLNQTDPVTIDGVSTPLSNLWQAYEEANGNIFFYNNGEVQEGFNNGEPIQQWFAPMTVDEFDGLPGTEFDENNNLSPCAAVNVDEAFSIVFLNEINAFIFALEDCSITFRVSGGLPEYDGSTYTSIELCNETTGNTIVLSEAYGHNDFVEVEIVEEGAYTIQVADGKSCTGIKTFNANSCSYCLDVQSNVILTEVPSPEINPAIVCDGDEINLNLGLTNTAIRDTLFVPNMLGASEGQCYIPVVAVFRENDDTPGLDPLNDEELISYTRNNFNNNLSLPVDYPITPTCTSGLQAVSYYVVGGMQVYDCTNTNGYNLTTYYGTDYSTCQPNEAMVQVSPPAPTAYILSNEDCEAPVVGIGYSSTDICMQRILPAVPIPEERCVTDTLMRTYTFDTGEVAVSTNQFFTCAAPIEGELLATCTNNEEPDASLSINAGTSFCLYDSVTTTILFEGTPPFTIIYDIIKPNDTSTVTITTNDFNYSFSLELLEETTIKLLELEDATCMINPVGTAAIATLNPVAEPQYGTPQIICNENDLTYTVKISLDQDFENCFYFNEGTIEDGVYTSPAFPVVDMDYTLEILQTNDDFMVDVITGSFDCYNYSTISIDTCIGEGELLLLPTGDYSVAGNYLDTLFNTGLDVQIYDIDIQVLSVQFPVFKDTIISIEEGLNRFSISGNNTFAENWTTYILNEPANGTIAVIDNGLFEYQANATIPENDEFTYVICATTCISVCDTNTVQLRYENDDFPEVICLSPNGDGIGDLLVFENIDLSGSDNNNLFIVDKNGYLVYHQNNYNNEWNGDGLEDGVYQYTIRITVNNKDEFYNGYILIVND